MSVEVFETGSEVRPDDAVDMPRPLAAIAHVFFAVLQPGYLDRPRSLGTPTFGPATEPAPEHIRTPGGLSAHTPSDIATEAQPDHSAHPVSVGPPHALLTPPIAAAPLSVPESTPVPVPLPVEPPVHITVEAASGPRTDEAPVRAQPRSALTVLSEIGFLDD